MLEVIAFGPDGGDKSNDYYLFINLPLSNWEHLVGDHPSSFIITEAPPFPIAN